MKQCVFIERDGVLTEARVERAHPVSPTTLEELKIKPRVASLVKSLKAAGLMVVATTNQPGISRGYLPRRELDRMHNFLSRTVDLDDIFVCPHDESDRCSCRKPKPGLFIEAGFKWHLELERCFVVSDKWQDAEAAWAIGCTSVLIESPWIKSCHRDAMVSSLEAAVDKILQLHANPGSVIA